MPIPDRRPGPSIGIGRFEVLVQVVDEPIGVEIIILHHFPFRARLVLGVFLIFFGVLSALNLAQAAERINDSPSGPGINRWEAVPLQKVVALCATQPGSAQFQQAWSDWVRANPQADIEATVQSVISQAGTLDSMSAVARDPSRSTRRPSNAELTEYMQLLATRARRSTSVRILPAGDPIPEPVPNH